MHLSCFLELGVEHELVLILKEHLSQSTCLGTAYTNFNARPSTGARIGFFTIRDKPGGTLLGFVEVYPTKVRCLNTAKSGWVSIDFHYPDAFEKLDEEICKMVDNAKK